MTSPLITQIDADLDAFFDSTNGFATTAQLPYARTWNVVSPAAIQEDADGAHADYPDPFSTVATVKSTHHPNDLKSTSGYFDFRIKMKSATWDPPGFHGLFKKGDPLTGNAAYQFLYYLAAGDAFALRADVSVSGVSYLSGPNSVPLSPFADGEAGWLRVTIQKDNGSGDKFVTYRYSVDDGASWIVISATVHGGAFTPFSSTGEFFVGFNFPGKIYRVEIYDGQDETGDLTLLFNPQSADVGKSSFITNAVVPIILTENALPPGATDEALFEARGKLTDLSGVQKSEGIIIDGTTYIVRGRRPHGDGTLTLLLDEA